MISKIKYFREMYTKDSVKFKCTSCGETSDCTIIKSHYNKKNKVITLFRVPYKWDGVIEILLNHLYGIHIDYEIFSDEIIQN